MSNNERQFQGVWIEKDIWLDKRLSALEKVILTEITSLDNEEGCTASNKYLAEFCQCSETKVSNAISKLLEIDYLELKSFNGRIRILKSRLTKSVRQNYKKCKAELQNVYANNIDNNIDIINNNASLPCNTNVTQCKEPKHKHGEYKHVLLTDNELNRLNDEYGVEQTKEAIKYLDEYIEMKGYKAKSHNLAIRKWVFNAIKEHKNTPQYKVDTKKPVARKYDNDYLNSLYVDLNTVQL